jgi:Sec-independent protein translocase protein TatA
VSYQALVPILIIFVVLLGEPKGILEILSSVSRWIKKRQNALRETS